MYDFILIDAKNILYRALFAAKGDGSDPAVIFLRILNRYRKEYSPKKWCLFWDVKKKGLWRTKIFPQYKEGRPPAPAELKKVQNILAQVCDFIGFTQYIKKANEADDLIYAFVLANPDKKILIVSSDEDVTQISYRYSNVDIYNPGKKDILEKPEYDPVIVKSLMGDKSDNIEGFRGVAKLTAQKIVRTDILEEFLEKRNGRKLFENNRLIIDLSNNPHLEDNIEFVRAHKENVKFDFKGLVKFIEKYKLRELKSSLSDIVLPFKFNRE
jgi:DNA polymerase-1